MTDLIKYAKQDWNIKLLDTPQRCDSQNKFARSSKFGICKSHVVAYQRELKYWFINWGIINRKTVDDMWTLKARDLTKD